MVNKRNTLGRGLGSLLKSSDNKTNDKIFDEIKIKNIIANNQQPRKSFDKDKIAELSLSIKQHGIIQPITVRRLDNRKFQFSNSILFDNVKSIFSKLMKEKWTEIKDVDEI